MGLRKQLFALRIKWETVRREFGIPALLDALFGGGVYATLAVFPFAVALVELMLMSMHLVNLFTLLFMVLALGYVALANRLAFIALRSKRPDHASDVGGLLRIHAFFWGGVVVLVGLLFLLFFIPALTA